MNQLTSSTESAVSTSSNESLKEQFNKSRIQKLIKDKDKIISYSPIDSRCAIIKTRSKRVLFNTITTQFIKCNECAELITYSSNTKSANRHFRNCKLKPTSSDSESPHVGKITSHLFNNDLPSEIKSDLSALASRVCSDDIRPFSLFNGSAFKNYCQALINLGAAKGKIDSHQICPDEKTVKRYTISNAEDLKCILIERFKSIKTFVVSNCNE